jgi:hypothetical protein
MPELMRPSRTLTSGQTQLVPKLDMAADVRAEAHKGRFSVMGEFLYMSLSDGKNTGTVVKKVDFRVDQLMADLGFAWRVVETPKGYLDVTAGVRYVNIYQKLTLQPDDERIGEIVDELAAAGTDLRRRLAEELAVLAGRNAQLPIAPLGGGLVSRLARDIANIRAMPANGRPGFPVCSTTHSTKPFRGQTTGGIHISASVDGTT